MQRIDVIQGGIDLAGHRWQVQRFGMRAISTEDAAQMRKMNSGSDIPAPSQSCGRCGKTIRMREGANTVLCTTALELVDADFEGACEYYEERIENPGRTSR
jgi:hypothetical protein